MNTPCCNTHWALSVIYGGGSTAERHYLCPSCGKAYSEDLYNTLHETAKAEVKKDFRGEDRCLAAWGIDLKVGHPQPPAHQDNEAQTERAKAIVKKWVSTNYTTWPICRFSQRPIPLEFWHKNIGEQWEGQVLRAWFKCEECAKR